MGASGPWRHLLWLPAGVLCVVAGCTAEDGPALGTPSEPIAVTSEVSVATSASAAHVESEASIADALSDNDGVAEPDAGATSMPRAGEVADAEQSLAVPVRDDGAFRRFEDPAAPQWPFVGVIQMWTGQVSPPDDSSEADQGWSLRYLGWAYDGEVTAEVPLVGFEAECLDHFALVSHGAAGVEMGEVDGSGKGSYFVSWGGGARRLGAPSPELVAEVRERLSNVEVSVSGDIVTLGSGDAAVDYAMRVPPRADGDWWQVQARRDGDLFVLTVHPSHLDCYSGVTWLSLVATGEVVACGANTWATRYVGAHGGLVDDLVLPDPDDIGTYLGCAPRLELATLPLKFEARDSR